MRVSGLEKTTEWARCEIVEIVFFLKEEDWYSPQKNLHVPLKLVVGGRSFPFCNAGHVTLWGGIWCYEDDGKHHGQFGFLTNNMLLAYYNMYFFFRHESRKLGDVAGKYKDLS